MKNSTIAIENSTQKSKMGIHKTNHKRNATLKTSQKYEGIRSKELNNGDIAYYVRWTDTNGNRFERKVGTKASGWSEKKAHLKRMDIINEPHTPTNLTLESIITRYLEIQKIRLKHQTFIDYKGQCLLHITPFFGAFAPQNIQTKHITDFMLSLEGKSNKTINKLLERLHSIMEFAITEYKIPMQNPLKLIKKLKLDNARERFLYKDEIEKLLHVAKEHKNKEVYYFFVLAFSTGARLNSILNIKLEDIDFKNDTIKIQDFKNNSKYTAFLTPLARQVLQEHTENIIFKTPERTITRAMQTILNELFNKELDPKDRKHRVVIHTTRHTFASHLAIKGTPIQIIQKLLNHKDIQMTMRYAHLLPNSGREWVEKLWE